MSITVIYSREETEHRFYFTKKKLLMICALFFVLLMACTWSIQGYYRNQLHLFQASLLFNNDTEQAQQAQLSKIQSEQKLFVLANKVGDLEVQMNRLNALGKRVVEKSNLPVTEFDFDSEVSIGGPDMDQGSGDLQFNGLLNYIEDLNSDLNKKEKRLDRLEITLNNLHLIDQLYISGRPVKGKGSWLSSPFGVRKDPFSGHLRQHKGVDIAGFIGMPIISTAAGVVTYSGKRGGYGLMVEIHHGNGLVTRYAHAQSLNVSVGDIVSKGQQIAVMGSTGRSTGAHVHYEVLKNGTQINPDSYIQRKAV